jgi:hypothetical protein
VVSIRLVQFLVVTPPTLDRQVSQLQLKMKGSISNHKSFAFRGRQKLKGKNYYFFLKKKQLFKVCTTTNDAIIVI